MKLIPGMRSSMVTVAGLLAAFSLIGSANAEVTDDTYRVQSGDTLASIAARFDTTVQFLADVNDIDNINLIYAGQVLDLSGSGTGNETDDGDDGASAGSVTYTVQAGDTLAAIAARYDTSVAVLAQANRIANVNLIHVGQTLDIPGSGSDEGDTDSDTGTGQGDPTLIADYTVFPVDRTNRAGNGLLVDARIGEHEGYDRIVFEYAQDTDANIQLANGVPGYLVEYVESATECGSGFPVTSDGEVMLRVHLPGSYIYNPDTGEATVDNLELTADHQVIVSAEEVCGFEGHSTWILGLTSGQPFRIHEITDPPRLVIDVATD